MHNSDGRNSAQGGRKKPRFEYKLVSGDEPAKQTVQNLGAKWGVGSGEGPRRKRKQPSSPTIPGGSQFRSGPGRNGAPRQ